MTTRLIALPDLTEQDLAHWRELAERAQEPNPFFEPEYVLPLAQGLDRESEVAILAREAGDAWDACMPVHAGRWHRIPLPSVAGWRGHPLYGLLGTPLVAADGDGTALEELVAGLTGAPDAYFVAFEEFADDGPVGSSLVDMIEDHSPPALRIEGYQRPAVRRRREFTYIEETLSGKRRKDLRRRLRRLSERLDDEVATVDRAGEATAVERFIRLESAGRKGEHGTVLEADPGHSSFFTEMCRAFAAGGRLQMLCLEGGGETVAMQCNLLAGNTLFGLKIAYDERWAECSPGIQLEIEGMRAFHENPALELMDSCSGHRSDTFSRLWPDRRSISTYAVPATGVRGLIARPVLRLASAAREWNRQRR